MNVKQERHDEAEIRELAAKFVEANKAKMAIPQRTPQPANQSGMSILCFLQGDKNKAKNNVAVTENDTKNIDEESIKGRFGWTLMGKMHIPYILRSGESYCAVRMVEIKVLNKLLNYLHQDLYNCTNIRSYYITEAEARLLNEINFKHCDYQFGREQFTSRDLIVRLTDANEFYQFLGHCYAKLVNTTDAENLERCGFIRINRESVVPYTVYNDQKYVPLFYFEGETDNLKQRADKLEGWDLSYLKFCCKVQGIRNELFAHDSCSVISLNDIKNYFPPGTVFEDYWPKKNLDSQLLISRNSNQQQIVQWTRQPIAPPITAHPPPSPKPATQAKAAANNSHMHNVHVFSNYGIAGGQPPYHAAQPRTGNSPVRATYPSAAARHMRPYFSNIGQAPPPLVRANTTTLAQYNAQTKAAGNYMILEPNINQQNSFHQTSQSNYPPPLLHMNGGISRYEAPQQRSSLDQNEHFNTPSTSSGVVENGLHQRCSPNYQDGKSDTGLNGEYFQELQNNFGAVTSNSTAQMVNQQPAHQATRTQPSPAANEERSNVTNGRSMLNNINRNKLISLPDTPPTSGNNIPYKIQKALVEGKMIPCINMKPNIWTDMLVSLHDLISNFFNNVTIQSCQQVMQVLGIEVYKANANQMRALMENGRCQNANETIPLVQVRNVVDFMPQLKYMLSGMLSSDVASKRQRNS